MCKQESKHDDYFCMPKAEEHCSSIATLVILEDLLEKVVVQKYPSLPEGGAFFSIGQKASYSSKWVSSRPC